MEESTSTTPRNNTVVIVLIALIVLLAGVIAYFLLSDSDSGSDAAAPAAASATDVETSAAMPAMTTEDEFDPATATRVVEGVTPEQHVEKYFDAVLAGDYETAYAMLPTSKQESYGSVDAFSEQLTGYGMTDYSHDPAVEQGEETQVTATAVMPGGSFQYLWTFVKDGESWLVKARTLPGMGG
ncbi:MAG: hypothetical protein RBS17_02250 [Coriobacteriia bacterium]|nr:hypothetical protein [Coriobacteriia bacterium]